MSKYDPLGAFLASRSAGETPMTFAEVEGVIGAPLPAAAGKHAAWWSNNPRNNVMTQIWLDAGYRTERVDLGGRKVVFRKVGLDPLSAPLRASVGFGDASARPARSPSSGTPRHGARASRNRPRRRSIGEAWDAEG